MPEKCRDAGFRPCANFKKKVAQLLKISRVLSLKAKGEFLCSNHSSDDFPTTSMYLVIVIVGFMGNVLTKSVSKIKVVKIRYTREFCEISWHYWGGWATPDVRYLINRSNRRRIGCLDSIFIVSA